jgi:hypothetical protein
MIWWFRYDMLGLHFEGFHSTGTVIFAFLTPVFLACDLARPCRWHRLHLCICLLCGSLLIAAATLLILCRPRSKISVRCNAVRESPRSLKIYSSPLALMPFTLWYHKWQQGIVGVDHGRWFFVVFNIKYCKVRQQRDQILDNFLPGKLLATSVMSSYVKLHSGGKRCSNQMLFILWSYFSLETPGTKPTEQRSMSTEAGAWRVNLRRIAMTRATYCQRRAEDTQKLESLQNVLICVNGEDVTGFKSFVVSERQLKIVRDCESLKWLCLKIGIPWYSQFRWIVRKKS